MTGSMPQQPGGLLQRRQQAHANLGLNIDINNNMANFMDDGFMPDQYQCHPASPPKPTFGSQMDTIQAQHNPYSLPAATAVPYQSGLATTASFNESLPMMPLSVDTSMSSFPDFGTQYADRFRQQFTSMNQQMQNNPPYSAIDSHPQFVAQECFPQLRRESMPNMPSQSGLPPIIKSEESPSMSHIPFASGSFSPQDSSYCTSASEAGSSPVASTDIDNLMKVVQKKTPSSGDTSIQRRNVNMNAKSPKVARSDRRYPCPYSGCLKTFQQKTHLDIHLRAHNGTKPFKCNEPGCNQTFSQMGNLKTHQRRHSGERPFKCPTCHKAFAQRGNVNAHRIVHAAEKPFTCKLDKCEKRFTQLGNLKSHQNKFHSDTIQYLMHRFATNPPDPTDGSLESQLFRYFSDLYKNCNKGIKGRGKDRRISIAGIKQEDADQARRGSLISMGTSSSSFDGSSPINCYSQFHENLPQAMEDMDVNTPMTQHSFGSFNAINQGYYA